MGAIRAERIDDMRERCETLLLPAFVSVRVAPLINETGAGCTVDVLRAKGSRLTLRYRFPSGTVVYGKAYRGDGGRRLFNTLHALKEAGFNHGGSLRIPEPLDFLEQEKLLLMSEARGAMLSHQIAGCSPATAASLVRAAARWLLALQSAPIPGLTQEEPCERLKILKESDVLVQAASAHPEHSPALVEFLSYVEELANGTAVMPPLVPAHGQFTPNTLFVDADTVTAIDLDTVSLADPAKDVATFVSWLKYHKLPKAGGEPAQAACLAREFLDEYTRPARQGLRNLPYYTALYCLKGFAKALTAAETDPTARADAERICRAELQRCLQIGVKGGLHDGAPECTPARFAQGTGARNGHRGAAVAAALWAAGFGHGAYRVPWPAALLPRAAAGVPLSVILENGGAPAAITGGRAAAHWLLALHRSHVRVGLPESDWRSLKVFRIVQKSIEACARFPEFQEPLLEILSQLKYSVARLAASSAAQTHGSYRPEHVWIAHPVTTATHLDRSLPADAAKDVAEFVTDLRCGAYDLRYDARTAARAEEAFLEAYLSETPELEVRVARYSACYLALRLLESLEHAAAANARWSERFELYREAIGKLCKRNPELVGLAAGL